jgi:hypothetical protein
MSSHGRWTGGEKAPVEGIPTKVAALLFKKRRPLHRGPHHPFGGVQALDSPLLSELDAEIEIFNSVEYRAATFHTLGPSPVS